MAVPASVTEWGGARGTTARAWMSMQEDTAGDGRPQRGRPLQSPSRTLCGGRQATEACRREGGRRRRIADEGTVASRTKEQKRAVDGIALATHWMTWLVRGEGRPIFVAGGVEDGGGA